MPWVRNNQAMFNADMRDVYNQALGRTTYNTYRSRNPIDNVLPAMIQMMFELPIISDADRTVGTAVNIYSLPRGIESAVLCADIEVTLSDLRACYNRRHHIAIYNTNSNQAAATTVVTHLLSKGWTQHDFRTALSCDPFHSTIVLHKADGVGGQTVIFSTIITDAFILKVAAVIPILYGYTLPTEITTALLEGDKGMFSTAYFKEIGELLKRKAQQKILNDLDKLGNYLKTAGKDRLESTIDSLNNTIRDYIDSLNHKYMALQEAQLQLASTYWTDISENATAFINYIKEHSLDMITKLQFNGSYYKVELLLVTTMLYWDEQLYKNYIQPGARNFITNCGKEEQALLTNIFIDKTVEIIFQTGIKLNFSDNTINKHADLYNIEQRKIGIPHTHTHYYNCFGNNAPLINKAFNKQDYIVLWEQIKSTLSGINVTDSTVFQKLIQEIVHGTASIPFLRLKDTGECISNAEFFSRYPNGYVPVKTTEPEPKVEPVKPARKLRRATVEREEE